MTTIEKLNLAPLEKKFIAIVRNVIESDAMTKEQRAEKVVKYGIELIEDSPDFTMCNVTVTPSNGADIDVLQLITARLEEFTTFEQSPFRYADKWWLIGDGDDGGAVFFCDGSFRVWLRGWKENPHC